MTNHRSICIAYGKAIEELAIMNKPGEGRDCILIFCRCVMFCEDNLKHAKLFLFTSNKGVKKCPHIFKAVKLGNLQNKIRHTTLGQCLVSIVTLLCQYHDHSFISLTLCYDDLFRNCFARYIMSCYLLNRGDEII